ncbi:hypothetical protein [Fodinicola acaciae]|uniref:hypothetical protein n=1 Tax=Fodinicola acaciae TaxID=2681555 RepID=UPI0013D7241B|nr:hypothetical protein [Fodinicola acaciae]
MRLSNGAVIGIVAGALVIVLCVCAGGAGAVVWVTSRTADPTVDSSATAGGVHAVTYRADSDDDTVFQVEYDDDSAVTQTESYVDSPWTDYETIDGADVTTIHLYVRNNDTYQGKITCSITVDGNLVDTRDATGSNAIANCSATLS